MSGFREIEMPDEWLSPQDTYSNLMEVLSEPAELRQTITPDLENWNPNEDENK